MLGGKRGRWWLAVVVLAAGCSQNVAGSSTAAPPTASDLPTIVSTSAANSPVSSSTTASPSPTRSSAPPSTSARATVKPTSRAATLPPGVPDHHDCASMTPVAGRSCHDRIAVPVPSGGQLIRSDDTLQAEQLCSAVSDAKLKELIGIAPKLGIETAAGQPATCEIQMVVESSTQLEALIFIVNLDRAASFDRYKVPTTVTYAGHKSSVLAYPSDGVFDGFGVLSLNRSSAVNGVVGVQVLRATRKAENVDTTERLTQTYLGALAAALL